MHEPILMKLREMKAFEKKVKKAQGKREDAVVNSLNENRPVYTLDHLVKERYPSFLDALRDLDDALSMIFLFSTLPTDDKISNQNVKECQRLSAEFQNYIMVSRSLQKTFLSIKGIYYQAEIKGQPITWIVPYPFAQNVPTDVDFRVMATFLEFYRTLLGFVNYKLYSDLNLQYPPVLNKELDGEGAGLAAYVLQSSKAVSNSAPVSASSAQTPKKISKKQLESLQEKISTLKDETADESDEEMTVVDSVDEMELDSIPVLEGPAENPDEVVPSLSTWIVNQQEISSFQSLFSKTKFYLNREVSRYSLEFVIRSFGGQVGWDETAGAGSPYSMQDASITHHILDRPMTEELSKFTTTRVFIQPQWVYDCINARKLLKTTGYLPGETLPAHLSPFVQAKEGDYVPGEENENESDAEKAESDLDVEETEEQVHQQELEAEIAGKSVVVAQEPVSKSSKKKKIGASEKEEKEARELAKIMMSKKDKHLYNQIQHSRKKKSEATELLKQKKKQLKKK